MKEKKRRLAEIKQRRADIRKKLDAIKAAGTKDNEFSFDNHPDGREKASKAFDDLKQELETLGAEKTRIKQEIEQDRAFSGFNWIPSNPSSSPSDGGADAERKAGLYEAIKALNRGHINEQGIYTGKSFSQHEEIPIQAADIFQRGMHADHRIMDALQKNLGTTGVVNSTDGRIPGLVLRPLGTVSIIDLFAQIPQDVSTTEFVRESSAMDYAVADVAEGGVLPEATLGTEVVKLPLVDTGAFIRLSSRASRNPDGFRNALQNRLVNRIRYATENNMLNRAAVGMLALGQTAIAKGSDTLDVRCRKAINAVRTAGGVDADFLAIPTALYDSLLAAAMKPTGQVAPFWRYNPATNTLQFLSTTVIKCDTMPAAKGLAFASSEVELHYRGVIVLETIRELDTQGNYSKPKLTEQLLGSYEMVPAIMNPFAIKNIDLS